MDELKTVNCEQLMTTPLKPIEFYVDGMISSGLFILAGAPKVGKSWLALDIALSIAKGERVLHTAPNPRVSAQRISVQRGAKFT